MTGAEALVGGRPVKLSVMVMSVSSRTLARTAVAAVCAAPVALLSACAPPNESASAVTPAGVPPVWTGAPAAAPSAGSGGHAASDSLTTHLKTPDGTEVATATFEFVTDPGGKPYVKVTVQSTGAGHLTPGFHGLHIHTVGKCEADPKAPNGDHDFVSAGGHLQVAGHTTEPASGDLTSLQVRSDGAALLVTTTDAFTKEDLVGGDGTAIVIHGGADNFANIPRDRYTQVNGAPGPDQKTLDTGDAGARAACGVIKAG